MPGDSLQEQLIQYLTDVHSTQQNALSTFRASTLQDLEQMGVAG